MLKSGSYLLSFWIISLYSSVIGVVTICWLLTEKTVDNLVKNSGEKHFVFSLGVVV